MRVLFDENVPDALRHTLSRHRVGLAVEFGWAGLKNGVLLSAAEADGFDVLVTADQNIRYQQNLGGRRIAIVALGSNRWPYLRRHLAEIAAAVKDALPGSYAFVEVPLPPKPKYQ